MEVLILVLLGYGLVGLSWILGIRAMKSLNPCFVGIWSCRQQWFSVYIGKSLNPCFVGIWSCSPGSLYSGRG